MKQSRARQVILILSLLGLGGIGIAAFRSQKPVVPIEPSIQFLPGAAGIPSRVATAFERWVPMSWSWLWRLRDSIRGPLPGILIDAKVIDCSKIPEQSLMDLIRPSALAQTNGMRGWILDNASLETLGRKLEEAGQVITRPRVQTSHEIQSTLSVGSASPIIPGTQVGFTLELFPLIQRDGTDLITIFTDTEMVTNRTALGRLDNSAMSAAATNATLGITIRTNLAAGARWRFLDGTGLFLLCPPSSNQTRRVGVVVSATVTRSKR